MKTMAWLDDPAVRGAISDFARQREVKLTVHPSTDKADDFGFRQFVRGLVPGKWQIWIMRRFYFP